MGRKPCSSGLGLGLNRGAWTPREDLLLKNYVQIHGEGNWSNLPMKAGLLRCGRSCRLRWMNYLRSGVKHDNISADEEELILRLHKLLGNRWSLIAARVPGRTDNQIKNLWYSRLSKKAAKTATQHCNVIKPVPYKYILPSPSENTVGFKAEIIHQDGIDGSVSNFLFQPTNYKGNQTRGCVDGEELVTKLPDWPFPQYVHNMAKGVTLIEMHNSVVNPNEIQNTIDQGFWSPSSSVSTAYY